MIKVEGFVLVDAAGGFSGSAAQRAVPVFASEADAKFARDRLGLQDRIIRPLTVEDCLQILDTGWTPAPITRAQIERSAPGSGRTILAFRVPGGPR